MMAKLFIKFKVLFLSQFGPFSQFSEQKEFFRQIWLCHKQLHMGFKDHAKIHKIIMIQFQEKVKTDGRME